MGCDKESFIRHIERQFAPWMTWQNYGSITTAVSIEDVIRLTHHTNLRPLCSFENRWLKAGECPQSQGVTGPPDA